MTDWNDPQADFPKVAFESGADSTLLLGVGQLESTAAMAMVASAFGFALDFPL
jgi:hypothetical protein